MNVIAQVGFELAYFETAVRHFSYYARETPLYVLSVCFDDDDDDS